MKKLAFLLFMLFFLTLFVMPAYAQEGGATSPVDLTALSLGLAAAGCGIAQSRLLQAFPEIQGRPIRSSSLSSSVWPLSNFWPC